jgi:hypothetical protein
MMTLGSKLIATHGLGQKALGVVKKLGKVALVTGGMVGLAQSVTDYQPGVNVVKVKRGTFRGAAF